MPISIMSKRPGEDAGGPGPKRPTPGQDMMDSEPILQEEYEDQDDEDVFLNDVLDQKARMLSGCRPSSFEPRRDRDRSREMRPPPPAVLVPPPSRPPPLARLTDHRASPAPPHPFRLRSSSRTRSASTGSASPRRS